MMSSKEILQSTSSVRSASVNITSKGQFAECSSKQTDYTGEDVILPDESQPQSPIEEVVLIVPTTDEISMLVWTFRTCVLGLFACFLITFLNTYFSYRNEPIIITVTTVLIATAPLGKFMASALPNRFVRLPGTRHGFSLNPGPFTVKEHTVITIFASAGSARPGGILIVNMIKIFMKGHLEFLPGLIVTLSCELFAYSWALFLYKFLVEPGRMWWPSSLVNVSLVQALNAKEQGKALSRMRFFVICFMVSFAYYVLPGYLIPSISTVSVLCIIFKKSVLAQQLGSGTKGLGIAAVSFDWATMTGFIGSPLVIPSVAVLNIFVGFVIQAYILVPITYWSSWWSAKRYPLFSPGIFTRSGESYNITKIMTSHNRLDQSGLVSEGITYFSAFYNVGTGITFATFGAIFSQMILYHGKDFLRILRAIITLSPTDSLDVHTHLMKKYPQFSSRWPVMIFLGTLLMAIVNQVVHKDQLQMRWWGVLLSIGFVIASVLPICILVATTNQIPNLGIMSQYLMGYVSPGEPITNMLFRTYSTLVCTRTSIYLGNFKFGHYMKIPPKATFYAQLIGIVITALVSMSTTWWLSSTIKDICDTTKLPPNTPWTCPSDRVFYDQGIAFGLVGPKRLLTNQDAPYRSQNYYFIPGFISPIIVWWLGITFPAWNWIRLINVPLVIRGAWQMPPSNIVNNQMWIYVSSFFCIYVFKYHKKWWQKYNYVLSAALDAGTVLMALLLYYSLDEGKRRLFWWGRKDKNDHCPLASCPTAPGIKTNGCPVF